MGGFKLMDALNEQKPHEVTLQELPKVDESKSEAQNLTIFGLAKSIRENDVEKQDLSEYVALLNKSFIVIIPSHKDAPEGLFLVVFPMSATCYLAFRKEKDDYVLLKQDPEVKVMLGIA